MPFHVPQPSDELYLFPTGKNQIIAEARKSFVIDRLDFDHGINIYIQGALYPKKGFPTPEAIWACNFVKRLIIKFPLMLLSLKGFNEVAMKVINPCLLKEEYQMAITKEIYGFIFLFLKKIGYSSPTANDFAMIFSHLIEYDNAYRYRLEDIMSETTKERMIKRPIGELKRLLRIEKKRDVKGVSCKFKRMINLLCLALCLPNVRRAYRFALKDKDSDFACFQYDEADRYWVCQRTDYLFMGLSYEERQKKYTQYPQEVEVL